MMHDVDDAGDANNKKTCAHSISKSKYRTALLTLWQQVDAIGRRPVLLPTNFAHLRTVRVCIV